MLSKLLFEAIQSILTFWPEILVIKHEGELGAFADLIVEISE